MACKQSHQFMTHMQVVEIRLHNHELINVQPCLSSRKCLHASFFSVCTPASTRGAFVWAQAFSLPPLITKKKEAVIFPFTEMKAGKSWTGMMIIVAAIIILLWANQWAELAAAVSLCRMCWQRVVIRPQWTSKTGAWPNMMRRQKQKRLFHTWRRLGCLQIISYRTQ